MVLHNNCTWQLFWCFSIYGIKLNLIRGFCCCFSQSDFVKVFKSITFDWTLSADTLSILFNSTLKSKRFLLVSVGDVCSFWPTCSFLSMYWWVYYWEFGGWSSQLFLILSIWAAWTSASSTAMWKLLTQVHQIALVAWLSDKPACLPLVLYFLFPVFGQMRVTHTEGWETEGKISGCYAVGGILPAYFGSTWII